MGMTIAVKASWGGVASNSVLETRHWQMNVSSTKRPAGSLQSGAALSAAGTLVLGALLAAGLAHGQDAVPGARPAANPVALSDSANRADSANKADGTGKGSQAAAASGDTAGGSSASGTQGAPSGTQTGAGAQAAGQPGDGTKTGKPQPVCFQLTGRCVEGKKASTANTHNASKDGSSARRPLNLTAPDVRTVVSADELKEPLPSNDQIAEVQEADTVSVKSEGVPTDVPGGFGAIWWALNHPSQAWKIVVPAE
jgi:hypothetical protein